MATINAHTLDDFEQIFDDVRSDYSGRGMFGKKCFAIVFDGSGWELRGEIEDLLREVAEVDEEAADDVSRVLNREPRTDSMGLSTVYYWPSIQVEED